MSMAKTTTEYVCGACGGASPRWLGKCPHCEAWNTLTESSKDQTGGGSKNRMSSLVKPAPATMLKDVKAEDYRRIPTGLPEFDRVMGGGLVPGGVSLLVGEPGMGKSTLLLQILNALDKQSCRALYVTGEESVAQVALRSQRLGIRDSTISMMAETNLEAIIREIYKSDPAFLVIDSIQTMYSEHLTSAPGSVAQVRDCAASIVRIAKAHGIGVLMVCHVTKEGTMAGPRALEHIPDTVLLLEGESHSSFRILRASKNRFFNTGELGIWSMQDRGMVGVTNPSAIFLGQNATPVPGACVLATIEGARTILVEIQALVDKGGPSPRRLSVGLDRDRLAMHLAVLNRHAAVDCLDSDVFVNATGGLKITSPASDLAVMLSITSSLRGKALPKGFVTFGEVGLTGEVRPAPLGQLRLREAEKLGFRAAVIPRANLPPSNKPIEGMQIYGVERIEEAINIVRNMD